MIITPIIRKIINYNINILYHNIMYLVSVVSLNNNT